MRVYEVDQIEAIVSAVSAEMTPSLIEIDPKITGVHYMYGRDEEIVERLMILSQNEDKYKKYPLIWLVTPFISSVDTSEEEREVTFPKIYFIHGTDKDLISPQRYTKNFKPILCPIVDSFVSNIASFSYGLYKPFNTSELTYDEIIHDYWGKVKSGNSVNPLMDVLDAVELSNFKVKLSYKNC